MSTEDLRRSVVENTQSQRVFGKGNSRGGFPRREEKTRGPRRPVEDMKRGLRRNINERRSDDDKPVRYVRNTKSYKKECTVRVHDIHNKTFTASRVIEAAERICGENTVLAVVPNDDQKSYDITTDTEENALKLTNGLEIGN